MNREISIIVVAGGRGVRMNVDMPKQFLELSNKPVLMHTLECFYRYSSDMSIILVLPEDHMEFWVKLCKKHHFTVPHSVVKGGETRFLSVKNGLQKVDTKYVAIHDGVRPLVSSETLGRCFVAVKNHQAVIPVIDLTDSIRRVEDFSNSHPEDRTKFKLVQTPQVFDSSILKKCYELPYSKSFTDDASVVESAGHKVELVEGNRENIKITTPTDINIAESLLK